MDKTKVKGSMTVEMTLVLPVVLFVITFLISVAYLEYDRCIIDEDLRIGVARYSNTSFWRGNYQPESTQNSNSLYWSGSELVAMDGAAPTFRGDLLTVSAETEKELQNPVAGFMSSMGFGQRFTVQSAWKTQRYEPAQFLWKCRKVEKLGEKLHN